MHSSLLSHIRKYISLNEEEEELITTLTKVRQVKSKEYLLQAGEICDANYFVVEGCFRLYLITDYGTEQIVQFGIDNWWIADYISLETKKPSDRFIQAVEKSMIIEIGRQAQEELFKSIPQLERYFRIIFQRAYAAQLNRIHYMLNLSGEERYHHFFNAFPGFVQRVPQYMLASYLGFTPEFLSKVRGKKG